jgi:tetratricopeptide (TPR) repeat protein
MLRPWLALLLTSSLLAGATRTALADDAQVSATDRARARYQQGAQAYAAGRYKDAIDLFLDADRLAPNPAFAYNIGLGYEELGDAPNALRWYRDYLRALPNATDRDDIEPRIARAEGRLKERGVQQVTILSTPDGATITLDGRRVGVTPWTAELTPGSHEVSLELRGFADASTTFELIPEHAMDVPLTLSAEAAKANTPIEPVGGSQPEQPSTISRVGPLTWGAFGVGVAGLGTALGFELARSAAVSRIGGGTQLSGHDAYNQATTYQTVARVSVGVGAAFAAVGGVLLYLDLSGPAPSTRTGVAAGCSGPLCGVTLDGAF